MVLISNKGSRESPAFVQSTLDTVVGEISPGTTKSANTEWFATDRSFSDEIPSASRATFARLDVSVDAKSKIDFTFNSGTTWVTINDDKDLKKDALYAFEFGVTDTDNFNIRAQKNVDINRCIICIEGQQG